ncbi:MAG: hypothetical protein BWY09_01312 [Candidatus Hydrogenedentes bacterium ADurb.Bin179]|nr:MAG: hypothetical protein BWY09_01312 [Candidatus Hydrogenedentes bacterium ADurb.Bin179]
MAFSMPRDSSPPILPKACAIWSNICLSLVAAMVVRTATAPLSLRAAMAEMRPSLTLRGAVSMESLNSWSTSAKGMTSRAVRARCDVPSSSNSAAKGAMDCCVPMTDNILTARYRSCHGLSEPSAAIHSLSIAARCAGSATAFAMGPSISSSMAPSWAMAFTITMDMANISTRFLNTFIF